MSAGKEEGAGGVGRELGGEAVDHRPHDRGATTSRTGGDDVRHLRELDVADLRADVLDLLLGVLAEGTDLALDAGAVALERHAGTRLRR